MLLVLARLLLAASRILTLKSQRLRRRAVYTNSGLLEALGTQHCGQRRRCSRLLRSPAMPWRCHAIRPPARASPGRARRRAHWTRFAVLFLGVVFSPVWCFG